MSEAIFAKNLLNETPADAVSCVFSKISFKMASAVSFAELCPTIFSVISK